LENVGREKKIVRRMEKREIRRRDSGDQELRCGKTEIRRRDVEWDERVGWTSWKDREWEDR